MIPKLVISLCIGLAIPLLATESTPQNPSPPKITAELKADYLAIHAWGAVPMETTKLEHRLTLKDAPGPWTAAAFRPEDGGFNLDVPLPEWRWTSFELRASAGDTILTTLKKGPEKHPFIMLTPERIAALPETERIAWERYLDASHQRAEQERDLMAAECRKLNQPAAQAAPSAKAEFEMDSDVPESYYGSEEALKIASVVVSFQTPSGAWSKAVDYQSGPRAPGMQWTNNPGSPWHYCGTLDNRTTTEQIAFLAHTGRADHQAAAGRGIEWLLAAQYPNGGWPQNYPVEPGYHEAITLNDNAMLHAMQLLWDVSRGEKPFGFVDEALRQRAGTAFEKGIACLAASQVKMEGKPTVWGAQHDPLTLAPVAARKMEPLSLSGGESAELLKFLMREGPITPLTTAMIENGVAWLDAHRVEHLRKTKNAEGKTDYVPDPKSDEVYWARFYDVQTGAPMFAGVDDGKVYATFTEMAQHNKVGYDYFTTKPRDVVGKELSRWKKRVEKAGK